MTQPVNRQRRQFLMLSGLTTGTLLLAPLLSKLTFLEQTLHATVDAGTGDGGYGSSSYGGRR
jgi:hypothetical protein